MTTDPKNPKTTEYEPPAGVEAVYLDLDAWEGLHHELRTAPVAPKRRRRVGA